MTLDELLREARLSPESEVAVRRLLRRAAECRRRQRKPRAATTAPVYSSVLPTRRGYYVYRLWGHGDRCLYVGFVGDGSPRRLSARLAEHRKRKPWWPQVARIDAADCGDQGTAMAEEVAQTLELRPVYNIRLGGGYKMPELAVD